MQRHSVVAIVLTYDAPANAARCLEALAAQKHPVERVILVENPGRHRVDPATVPFGDLRVDHILLTSNGGPAGGYHEGLRRAAETRCDTLWVLDDDIVPEPSCLSDQLDTLAARGPCIVFPELYDAETGEPASTWGWCGALFPREMVDAIGLPDVELFYGLEDTDYLIDRGGRAGFTIVRDTRARAGLRRRPGQRRPVWHHYYLPRNATFLYLHRRAHVRPINRGKRLVRFQLDLYREMWHTEVDHKVLRTWYFARGSFDGALGRLGRPIDPQGGRPGGVSSSS